MGSDVNPGDCNNTNRDPRNPSCAVAQIGASDGRESSSDCGVARWKTLAQCRYLADQDVIDQRSRSATTNELLRELRQSLGKASSNR